MTDADGKCRDLAYVIGQDYTQAAAPVLCKSGFHFCRVANDCFNYYGFKDTNRVFAVEAFGETIHGDDKSVTNGLRLLRELTWPEVLAAVNQGKHNTGRANSGDLNSGDLNSGVFCSDTPKTVLFFDRPSTWSLQDFLDSEARWLTERIILTEWRPWSEMTEAEKQERPRAETAEGYLLTHDYQDACRTWWAALNERERGVITALPNFCPTVFHTITGITL
ncbi:MAG: hypothetical protein NVSMB30_13440 [Hymenobacter sp.]